MAERDGIARRAGPGATTPSAAALEHARYQAVYGIDLDDRSTYDLVLDSTVGRRPRRLGRRRSSTDARARTFALDARYWRAR